MDAPDLTPKQLRRHFRLGHIVIIKIQVIAGEFGHSIAALWLKDKPWFYGIYQNEKLALEDIEKPFGEVFYQAWRIEKTMVMQLKSDDPAFSQWKASYVT